MKSHKVWEAKFLLEQDTEEETSTWFTVDVRDKNVVSVWESLKHYHGEKLDRLVKLEIRNKTCPDFQGKVEVKDWGA